MAKARSNERAFCFTGGRAIRTTTICLALGIPALMAACAMLQPSTPVVSLTLHPGAQGVRVSYTLASPQASFAFTEEAGDIRADSWRTLTPGARLAANEIAFSTPARDFDIELAPDARNRDRIYPALRRVGAGWAVYAPHLLARGLEAPAFDIAAAAPAGWTVLGHRDARGRLVGDGWIYFGPAAQVERDAAIIAADPSTPAWLRERIAAGANRAALVYTQKLETGLGVLPTILIGYDPDVPDVLDSDFRGDVTPGAMMSIHFLGSSWRTPDAQSLQQVSEFIAHEMFHYWNTGVADSAENETRPWLHEGGASYAAMLAAAPPDSAPGHPGLETLNAEFRYCQANLRDSDSLTSASLTSGRAPYACGVVLQWAWDAGLRATSAGARDVLSLWRETIAEARRGDGKYSLEAFVRLAPAPAAKAASVLLSASGPDRWRDFSAAMGGYGARLSLGRDAATDRSAALMALLRQHCRGAYGFTAFDDHIKLDTGDRCGPLSGDPEVDSLAGADVVRDGSAVYDGLAQLCATGGSVAFGRRGKTIAAAPCAAPLPAAQQLWTIEKAFSP